MKTNFVFEHSTPEESAKKKPAIFLFHGYGSDERDLLSLVEDFKETHHIFSLRGPITVFPGYAFWNFEENGQPVSAEFDEVLKSAQVFINEAIQEYNLDTKNIVLFGFSQGAMLAQSLALIMGESISKVVALSGYVPDFVKEDRYTKKSVKHLKIFISHGIDDMVVPYQWGEESSEYLKSLRAKVTFKSYVSGHFVTPENGKDLVEFIKEE
ncbi:MAG: alpha/beta hydrolase [Candidatus Dojkabacteria bacterium]|jgi:phospholipase/carboxylesterase